MTNNLTHIGETIAYLRKQKGLSQAKLAEDICSREYVVKIEKGLQYPTTYTINCFCDKLGIDIYEEYSTILRHGSFENHKKITALNDCFTKERLHLLPDLINEYKSSCTTKDGELWQHICYAKAIYALDVLQDPPNAIQYALDGIHSHHPSFVLGKNLNQHTLTNIDIALIYYLSNGMYKQGNVHVALDSLITLYHYLKNRLSTNDYILHKKFHYEINMLSAVTLNIVVYNEDYLPLEQLYDMVSSTIELKKRHNYSLLITNLLFAKCYLCRKLSLREEYEKTLSTARNIGSFFIGLDGTKDLERWMLNKK